MNERDHCTSGVCPETSANDETVSIYVAYNHPLLQLGIHLRRDTWVSVMYAEGLNSAKSSVILQSTDRHGILGEKSADFQGPL